MTIQTNLFLAAKTIAPVWPLKTFIACNSLHGFEAQAFDVALNEAECLFEQSHDGYECINRETIKWCGAYFDEGQSVIEMPSRDNGFYAAFQMLAKHDKNLHQGLKQHKQWLNHLPENPQDAIIQCLNYLKISEQDQLQFFKQSLAQLPGWSGYIQWQSAWQNQSKVLMDYMAIRLIITVLLSPEIQFTKNTYLKKPSGKNDLINHIKTLEETYKNHLIPDLLTQAMIIDQPTQKPVDVQLVFCIDVRSEPFRRHLESLGPYETFGFAGFFGLPIRLHDYNSGKITDSCPVLLKPKYDIHECPSASSSCHTKQHSQGKTILDGLKHIYQQLKYNFATPFALVETLGAWCGLLMLSKTFQPISTISTIQKWIEIIKPTLSTEPMIDMAASEQALYAEAVLRIMGLTKNFGKLIIFCGHGSSTQNNPYASGLDCGACGGNHGGGNAKVLASILNKESIRETLSERGIYIPEDTRFLAAQHNTTTDDMHIFKPEEPILLYEEVFATLGDHLKQAQIKNSATRVNNFGTNIQIDPTQETCRRSQDWSEVRPEWGLARNAAFIIGPRKLTQAIDLEGRCFLHSYDWSQDPELTALETILTAPMVVAEWINTQYLFSTINNITYGSGSKITHNVTGKIGVMQGNSSDLMHGLPLQSVNASDIQNYHEPQRLLTVVYAPRKSVSTIIARQEILKTLFFNAWVNLIVIEPTEEKAYQLQTNGEWHLIPHKGEKK